MADIKDETIQINREFEERQTQETAESLGLNYVRIAQVPINPDLIKVIPSEVALKLKVIPFELSQNKLKIATVFPQDPNVKKYVEILEKANEVEVHVCSQTGFMAASKIYQSDMVNLKTVETRKAFEEGNPSVVSNAERIKALETSLKTMQAEIVLNEILLLGLEAKASDIHIQPQDGEVKLRFRVDGLLHEILTLETAVAAKLIARIKYESGTKSNVTDVPQDGRMGLEANNRKIDIRVSVIPTETLESVTLRILDMNKSILDFPDLGFDAQQTQIIQAILKEPNGMILMTGPTGSGKTTTLYTMLNHVNTPDRKLVTLEDPIEYHLPNVTQSQIDPNTEYDFERGLKAMLRHDPDVILIGEIRDLQSAKLATEASQTGHLVLSTLHTNSAIGAISRLRNLGMKNFNIASSIKAVMAQRLVRTLCPHCRKKVATHLNEREKKLADRLKITIPAEVYEAQGCVECNASGYRGRSVITELLIVNQQLASLITEDEPEHHIKQQVYGTGNFRPLFADGLIKVFNGTTSLKEIYRVVSLWDQ
ncbi:MAG TPA: GspE/PulE family protein [Candidatus Gracilibacteria bacterium]